MKKFRLLLLVSSLLAMTGMFTACNTEVADNYPTPEVTLTPGEVGENSISFTVNITDAEDCYYWVVEGAADVEQPELEMDSASTLDPQLDLPFEQVVTKTGLKAGVEYAIYALAKNFGHSSYATPITMVPGAAIPYPTVAAVADEEVFEDGFAVFVTTANAEEASWLVVPKYTEGVTADKVFADGTALAELNKEDVYVEVTGLESGVSYDFYVAAKNQGKVTLSDPVGVTTLAPEAPVIEVYFDTLMMTQDLSQMGLPGIMTILSSSTADVAANLVMFDVVTNPYAGYLAAGDYAAVTGSIDTMTALPAVSCIFCDPTYTNFYADGKTYFPIAKEGTDEYGNPYGVNVMTAMPDEDNNYLTFNLAAVDEAGNEVMIVGAYMGPLGYQLTVQAYPFNLNDWSFTNFTKKVEGNIVTLTSTSVSGDFVMVLQTEGGVIDGAAFTAGEGGNMTGGYVSYIEGAPETFAFTSGRISFEKVDDNGNYKLIVSTRGGDWLMQSQSGAYKIDALEYDITITDAQ